MITILKLTYPFPDGKSVYVNFENVFRLSETRIENRVYTEITSMGGDEVYVTETPDMIMNMIEQKL